MYLYHSYKFCIALVYSMFLNLHLQSENLSSEGMGSEPDCYHIFPCFYLGQLMTISHHFVVTSE